MVAVVHEVRARADWRGSAVDLMECRDPEVLIEGPAGTGKSFASLWKLHAVALKYPGMRGLMFRKTLTSLTASVLVTYQERVLGSGTFGVMPFGGSKFHPTAFRYPNGSVLVVGGMDKASKIMSSEYDVAYGNEATELAEDDAELVTSRLRYGVMPYQQLILDANPGPPSHWLNQRCNAGRTTRLLSRHEDNPALWDGERWTPQGAAYIATLDRLTGTRHARLRKGLWVAAEGQVYADWDPAIHLIDTFPIAAEWARFRVIDFGYRNPFVCQWWALSPDDDLFLYRELYQTGLLVSDAAVKINHYSGNETYQACIADHDAEDRATLLSAGIRTKAANKAVKTGIEAVQERMRPDERGKPRIYLMRGALVEFDQLLRDRGKPTCTAEEIDGYIWADKAAKEEPVKEDDHGMDTMRYQVMYLDGPRRTLVFG